MDEDLPRSLARRLRSEGFEVEDVRDVGLRGRSDEAIFERAQTGNLVVVTGDLGFGNVRRFPIGSHHGIVVARFPNEASVDTVNEAILAAMKNIEAGEIDGHLLIVQPGRIRLKRR